MGKRKKILTVVSFFLSCLLVFAAKAVGCKLFGATVETTTLLKANYPEEFGGKSMFPADTEALIYVMLVNNEDKWKNNIEWYIDEKGGNGNFKHPLPKLATKRSAGDPGAEKHHDAKFTSKVQGQSKYGTLSDDGLDLYEDTTMTLLDRRTGDTGKRMRKFEKEFFDNHLPAYLAERNAKKRKGDGRDGNGKAKRAKRSLILESDNESDDGWLSSEDIGESEDEEEAKKSDDDSDSDDDDKQVPKKKVKKAKKSHDSDDNSDSDDDDKQVPKKEVKKAKKIHTLIVEETDPETNNQQQPKQQTEQENDEDGNKENKEATNAKDGDNDKVDGDGTTPSSSLAASAADSDSEESSTGV